VTAARKYIENVRIDDNNLIIPCLKCVYGTCEEPTVCSWMMLLLQVISSVLFVLCVVTHGCLWNNCLCLKTKIICDKTNQPAPSFSPYERKFVRALVISERQSATLVTNCGDLPRLEYVEITDVTATNDGQQQCPHITCRGVKIVCM
jgi:hypothetical protein